MRMTTTVWLGIRSVGDNAMPIHCAQMTAQEALVKIVTFVKDCSIAKRFQFCIAATEEECRKGIADAQRAPMAAKQDAAFDMLMNIIDSASDDDGSQTEAMIPIFDSNGKEANF